MDFRQRLAAERPLWAVELRPPRRGVAAAVEPWIDMYHAVRRLIGSDTLVLTTDDAIGDRDEENLRHLSANLGPDTDLSRVVPFLTTKHPLDHCLRFPERALDSGHRASVIVGGDQHDGIARCVPHASDLRGLLKEHHPGLALGG